MRNFKVVKGDHQSRRNTRRLRLAIPPNSVVSVSKSVPRDPPMPLVVQDDKSSIPVMDAQHELARAFELLQTRWQSGVQPTLELLKHPKLREWSKRNPVEYGPIIFPLIEALVPEDEQFELYREFLEADLASQGQKDYPYSKWRHSWQDVLRCEDWDEAKELLEDENVISETAGDVFAACVHVVVAEHHLRDCRKRIECPEKFKRPLIRSCDTSFCDNHQLTECCDMHAEDYEPQVKYFDILREFRHASITVSASFYKYALDIVEWDTLDSTKSNGRPLANAEEYRRRYLELVSYYGYMQGKKAHSIVTEVTPVGSQASPPKESSPTSTVTMISSDRPRTSDSVTSGLLVSTQEAFQTLLTKWKTLNGFNEYALSLLPFDGWGISIFEVSAAGNENIFEVIYSSLPHNEQIPLVRAVLEAIARVKLTPLYSPWGMSWWSALYNSTSWSKFFEKLDLEKTTPQLERIMTPRGAKLFVDSTIMLVGEKMLLSLKSRLVAVRRTASGANSDLYRKLVEQYTQILKEFQRRDLKVEQAWLSYHLNIM